MARPTPDNFGNEGARAYLGLLAAKLLATINEIVDNDERLDLDEDGESMFMPSVELLALLCERYAAPPPQPDIVRTWGQRYLAIFDDQIGTFKKLSASYKVDRRRVIENTFRWLETLAETHWAGG
jgi:hypothetical protein